ncbi:adhesion G protein-coupled receptor L3-like [Cloeon dipterum]|uniref:adhesion G protein-coupled receptor L3-like n=1 Tax=Cloeon dipterum TaxID=197152 RepID=UPI0032202FCC
MDVINNFDKTTSLGWEMIKLVENFGFNVTWQAKNISENFNLTSIKEHYFMESQFLRHKQGGSPGSIIRFPMLTNNTWSSSIMIRELPNRTFRNDEEYTDIEAVGQIIPMAYAEKFFPAQFNRMNDTKKRMNSGLIHLTIYGPDRIPIEGGAAFVTFKHSREAKGPIYETIWHQLYPGENPTAIEGTEQCAYWVNSLSEWDTEGCRKAKSDRWSTECECNHTGPYVLLSDVHAKDVIMEIINIVFSTLSLLSLTLMLIVLYFFEENQEERNAIGKHLCLCLLIGHIMALTVLDRSYFQLSREMCVGAAVCLHYVFLAAFMWMAIEGHHLYRMVMRVFDSGRDFSKIYLWTGYGTPLLIVAATGITTAALQDYGYADDELCWLSTPFYIWAFMGPVFIITVMKLMVLALALRVTLANATQQIKTFRNRVKIWIMGWFLLSLLLIVTWLIGFFYIQFYHSFSYAFFALNGLQGVVIFLIRAVFNEKVRTTIKKRSKESRMMDRLYKIFWNQDSRNQTAASQPSPWVLGSSIISQEVFVSVAATSDWGSISTISVNSTIDEDQKPNQNPVKPLKFVFSGDSENFQPWLKKKSNKEEALEQSVLQNWKSVEIKEIWNDLRSDSIVSEIPEKEIMYDQGADADSDKSSNESKF